MTLKDLEKKCTHAWVIEKHGKKRGQQRSAIIEAFEEGAKAQREYMTNKFYDGENPCKEYPTR